MSGEGSSPVSILFDMTGVPMAVSASTQPNSGALGIVMAGFDATNTVRYASFDGAALRITGSVATSGGTQGSSTNSIFDSNGNVVRATVSEEMKVAQLYTLADLTNKYELDTRLWDYVTASGGAVAHVPLESAIRVSVNTTAASSASLRTNTYYKYQAGYTQLATLSVIHSDTGNSTQIREWGYNDDNDGLFFTLSGSSLGIVERSSVLGTPVDTFISQSSWNHDKMNGAGSSGINLNVSSGSLYEIEVQWYGVGTCRYFIDNVLVHESSHANTLPRPYMRTAQLPLQAKIRNMGASTAASMDIVCGRVAAQGQVNPPQEWLYAARNTTPVSVGLTAVPVLSIRPKATYNGITNRMWCLPRRCTVSTDGYPILFQIVMNPILTGASWTSVTSQSGMEYDVSATSYTGGEVIYADTIDVTSGNNEEELDQFFSVFGRMLRNAGYLGAGNNSVDVLSVVAVNTVVGNTDVKSNITWAEIR